MGQELLGSSVVMDGVRSRLAMLAAVPWHVRIEGPSGSGKGVAARMLHRLSAHHAGPFVACQVNAMADGLEVAELLGHARGAFTGAVTDLPGLFEAAHGGTLFIDEIATASLKIQLALLQLIDEGVVRRVGERRVRQLDVRVVFATNTNLEEAVKNGTFREDLFQRMGVLVVRMPALSEHREDIPELAHSIVVTKAREAGRECPRLGREAIGKATMGAFRVARTTRSLVGSAGGHARIAFRRARGEAVSGAIAYFAGPTGEGASLAFKGLTDGLTEASLDDAATLIGYVPLPGFGLLSSGISVARACF